MSIVPSGVTATLPSRAIATDSLVRCDHIGCPYPATKQIALSQRAGEQRLRFCAPHAGVWAQRCASGHGQTMTISDYPAAGEGGWKN